jgi:hypothetical protein
VRTDHGHDPLVKMQHVGINGNGYASTTVD